MTPKQMNARIEAHLLVAGVLCFVLFIAELWHRRWLAALLSAAMTTALFALAVTSMRRKDHHRKGRR
jgi:Flp pilus assembly protein TadB